jgi:hypothetical protein
MLLKPPTMATRSGSSVGGSRVVSSPPAIRVAAPATCSSGCTARRPAHTPNPAPAAVAAIAAAASTADSVVSTWRSSTSGATS